MNIIRRTKEIMLLTFLIIFLQNICNGQDYTKSYLGESRKDILNKIGSYQSFSSTDTSLIIIVEDSIWECFWFDNRQLCTGMMLTAPTHGVALKLTKAFNADSRFLWNEFYHSWDAAKVRVYLTVEGGIRYFKFQKK